MSVLGIHICAGKHYWAAHLCQAGEGQGDDFCQLLGCPLQLPGQGVDRTSITRSQQDMFTQPTSFIITLLGGQLTLLDGCV